MGIELQELLNGFFTALQPEHLIWLMIGGFLGTIVGMLPGLGPATAIAVLIPITFGMDTTSALIMLAAIYYGAMYGGSRSSILLNTPGDGSAIAATFDGYPMTKQGNAGRALTMATLASFIGGVIAIIAFIFLAQPLASFALKFGDPEYFLLMLFALSAIVSLSVGKMLKGFISMSIGLLLSTFGIDSQSGVHRFTFDIVELSDGVDYLVVIIGIYAVGEVLFNLLDIGKKSGQKNKVNSIKISREDWKRSRGPIIRNGPIGFLIGVLPGAGGTMASMLSYTTEKQISKNPDSFGKGAIEGVAAPESSNNAASIGSLIPMLTMGIPGSGTTAVMLGAIIMIGLKPGPQLFENDPGMIATFINSMLLGNIFLVIMNILLVGLLVKILNTPPKILYPLILILAFVGTYALNYTVIDFYILIIFGVIGLFFKIFDFPVAPLILAIIVGSDMEQHFRKSVVASGGDLGVFLNSTISIVLIILVILSILYPFIINMINRRRQQKQG